MTPIKILLGPDFIDESLHSLATARTKKRGVLRREPIESYQIGQSTMRAFRYIHFFDSDNNAVSTSLIDEEFTPLVRSFEEVLLLWRPRYVSLVKEDAPFDYPQERTSNVKREYLKSTVNDLINERRTAQEKLSDLRDDIVKIQDNLRSSTSLFLPRSRSSIRKHEEIAKMKRSADGVVKASSLVINCLDTSIVKSASIGNCVLVATTLIKFRSLENDSSRILALENPSTGDIPDALSKGRALTRLLDINEKCRQMLIDTKFD